jgi:hypothetical protein
VHCLTDAAGMPSFTRTTPATRDEWTQILPPLETLYIGTGKRGRPQESRQLISAQLVDISIGLVHRCAPSTRA